MDSFTSPIPNLPHFLSRNPIRSRKVQYPTLIYRNNSHRYKVPTSKFSQNFPFSTSKTKKFQIFANFGRSPNRRNSLRKKLVDNQQVHPTRNFDEDTSFLYDLDSHSVKESDSSNAISEDIVELRSNETGEGILGNPVLLSKLEKWADQYKKDVEIWGIGSGPIFTVFQDLDDNVKNVVVSEDEIRRRSGEFEESIEVNLKISNAKQLAKEMESGSDVIPKNSSVAKFVVTGKTNGFLNVVQGVIMQPNFYPKVSRVGIALLCGCFMLWMVKRLFSFKKKNEELTSVEKEMLRRKMKSRMEKEKIEKGSVEVIQDPLSEQAVFTKRPKLDKQELTNTIMNVKGTNDKLSLRDSSSAITTKDDSMDSKIQEIREMARKAREIEGANSSLIDRDEDEDLDKEEEVSNEGELEGDVNLLSNASKIDLKQILGTNGSVGFSPLDELKHDDIGFPDELDSRKSGNMEAPSIPSPEIIEVEQVNLPVLKEDSESTSDYLEKTGTIQNSGFLSEVDLTKDWDMETQINLPVLKENVKSTLEFLDKREVTKNCNSPENQSPVLDTRSAKTKPRIIRSIKEAREFLSRKRDQREPNQEFKAAISNAEFNLESARNQSNECYDDDKIIKPHTLNGEKADIASEAKGAGDSIIMEKEILETKENWLENNFHELEPVIKKIRSGFKENYSFAKERDNKNLNVSSEMNKFEVNEEDSELDWMKDDHLREIVFQVRENELAGRDPFHMMDAEDKTSFFEGLERKVEKVNGELLNVHEWVHSNIENLDYRADGISIYDSPEKFIPRWKGPPPIEKNPEYLDNFMEQRKAFIDGKNVPEVVSLQNSKESLSQNNLPISSIAYDKKNKFTEGASKNAKIVIEGSDGSVRPGKKTGKEYWQHTKKWSRDFLESYNAESDPEVKSTMKDIGKDLNRWITEKEVEEAAELLTKLPEKNRQFIEKKLEKLKREMELYGQQAVVSKYREYADEKEEDYLWWLDLPFVLCIELYTNDNGEQRIGFYTLEMAPDLELEPKQYHVIAFEDSGDCKNLCYIIQAHLEMLGNGNAFVVARPPKDAFREAKANGFSVSVIRKGELKLNIDQTLEEVEEEIIEIGSKIYHDKITKERSVSTSSIMKGVFGFGKPSKRTSSKKRKRLKRSRKQ